MKLKSMEFSSKRQAQINRYSIKTKTSKIYKKNYPSGKGNEGKIKEPFST